MGFLDRFKGETKEIYMQRVKEVMGMLDSNQDEALDLANGIISDLSKHSPDEIKQRNLTWETVNAFNLKGSILNGRNDIDGAEKCFNEVLEKYDACDSCALMNMGIISKKREQYDLALEYYDKALVEAPEGMDNFIESAKQEVYSLMGSAVDEDLDNYSPKVKELIEKGKESIENQNYWVAFDCFEQAKIEDSSCGDLADKLIEDTKERFEVIFQTGPIDDGDDEASQLKRAALYHVFKSRNPSFAFAINEEYLNNFDSHDPFALNTKGIIYFYLDELEKAVEAFDECLDADNDYLYANFNKAIVLKRMKRVEEARESFGEIMRMPSRFSEPSEDLLRLYRLTVAFNSIFYIDLL